MRDMQKCDHLKIRIKAWIKKRGITQPQFAQILGVGEKSMRNFMSGAALTQSDTYLKARKYLETRQRSADCQVSVNIPFSFAKVELLRGAE